MVWVLFLPGLLQDSDSLTCGFSQLPASLSMKAHSASNAESLKGLYRHSYCNTKEGCLAEG